jgi:predicted GH43/DUF377 family glycosyl hydrolase
MAKSADLFTWKKMKTYPIPEGSQSSWDSDFIAHGFVYKERNTFVMLYDGSRRGNWLEEIGMATSTDIIHWKKHEDNPIFHIGDAWWEKRHVSRCSVYKNSDTYFLYYAGHDGQRERIGLATGKNIKNLTTRYKDPVLDVGGRGSWDEKSISDPHVIRFENRYLMFYSGIDMKGIERTGLATSSDLIHWKKYAKNPILDVSCDGWDKISASRACPFVENGTLYLFYSGRKKYFYSIGLAEVEVHGI